MNIWAELGIAPTTDQHAIRRAYAARLKRSSPEDDQLAFQRLRSAYEAARFEAQYLHDEAVASDDAAADRMAEDDGAEPPVEPSVEPLAPQALANDSDQPRLVASLAEELIATEARNSDIAAIEMALRKVLADIELLPTAAREQFEQALMQRLLNLLPVPLPLIEAASRVLGWQQVAHRFQNDGRWLLLEVRVFLAEAENTAARLVEDWTSTLAAADIDAALQRWLAAPLLAPFRVREHFERCLIRQMLEREVLPLSLAESALVLLGWDDEQHPQRREAALPLLLDRMEAAQQIKAGASALARLQEIERGNLGAAQQRALALLRKPPKPYSFWLLRRHRSTAEAVQRVIETLTILDGKTVEQQADAASLAWWRAALASPGTVDQRWIQGFGVLGGLSAGIAGGLRRWLFEDLRWFGSPWPVTVLIAVLLMITLCLAVWALRRAGQWWKAHLAHRLRERLLKLRGHRPWRQALFAAIALFALGSAGLQNINAQFVSALLAYFGLGLAYGRMVFRSTLRGLLVAAMLLFGLINAVLQDEAGAGLLSLLLVTAGHAEMMQRLSRRFALRLWPAEKAERWLRRIDIAWWVVPLLIALGMAAVVLVLDPKAASGH